MIRTRLNLRDQRRVLMSGLILLSLASSAAWGQWLPAGATSGPIYYNGGNVGIGTTSPTSPLQIAANTGSPYGPQLSIVGSGETSSGLDLSWDSSSGYGAIATVLNGVGTGSLVLQPNGGNVGIANFSPKWPLHIGSGSTAAYGANGIELSWGNGAGAARDWVVYSDQNFHILDNGYNQYGNGTGVPFFTIMYGTGNVGIGTTSPAHTLEVAGSVGVQGTIISQEVLVSATGADYVFDPAYRLQPLSEVAAYIQANRHLPDIPSADEVKQKGMGVGEMEAKLLAKIEELTLHMIQQEKENQELRDRIARIEKAAAR